MKASTNRPFNTDWIWLDSSLLTMQYYHLTDFIVCIHTFLSSPNSKLHPGPLAFLGMEAFFFREGLV